MFGQNSRESLDIRNRIPSVKPLAGGNCSYWRFQEEQQFYDPTKTVDKGISLNRRFGCKCCGNINHTVAPRDGGTVALWIVSGALSPKIVVLMKYFFSTDC